MRVLSGLALTRPDPRAAKACEIWILRFSKDDGGFGIDGSSRSHLCLVGNTARALIRLGCTDHPRVRSALEWLVDHQAKLGGWSGWGSGRNLDAVHPDVQGPIAAWFDQHPRHRATPVALERVGGPSNMVTLKALRVLCRGWRR